MKSGASARVMILGAAMLLGCGSKESDTEGSAAEGSSSPETAGEATTGTATTAAPTTGPGPADSHAPCDRYLACAVAAGLSNYPTLLMTYGETGICWQGSVAMAEQCREACRSGLELDHEVFPDEPACTPCADDDDCASDELCTVAGECLSRCVDGGPFGACACADDADCGADSKCSEGSCGSARCGDGKVQRGELCDGQDGCDPDCKGPFACTPLFNTGCTDMERCEYDTCQPGNPPTEVGDECLGGLCAGGQWCFEDYLCHALCAVGGDPCVDGLECVGLGGSPPYDYLGVCIPP